MRLPNIEKITRNILSELSIETAKNININKVAKHLNVNVKKESLEYNISGFFVYKDNQAHIVCNNTEDIKRQKFTIAHELGHYVLHKLPLSLNMNETKLYRNTDSTTGEYKQEREANAFAASLLMPKDFIDNEIDNAPDDTKNIILYLANVFNVSEQAMTYRLSNIGYNLSGVY